MTGDKVVRLISVAPGFKAQDDEQLFAWLRDWVDQVEEDGNARSLILMVETRDGNVYHLGQTTHQAAGAARVLGLLDILGHKILHGKGSHPLLEKEDS